MYIFAQIQQTVIERYRTLKSLHNLVRGPKEGPRQYLFYAMNINGHSHTTVQYSSAFFLVTNNPLRQIFQSLKFWSHKYFINFQRAEQIMPRWRTLWANRGDWFHEWNVWRKLTDFPNHRLDIGQSKYGCLYPVSFEFRVILLR
jgi:hypothetical protein